MPIKPQLIKDVIIKSVSFYLDKKQNDKDFQILDLLIPREREIRSKVGGLETSLGKTLWEPLAKAIAEDNVFKVINKDLPCPTNIPAVLQDAPSQVLNSREARNNRFDAKSSLENIKLACATFIDDPIEKYKKAPQGNGVDIWLQKTMLIIF